MKGVILAAGMATRLKPLTNETPKTLLKIKNKPILGYILDNFIKNGISDFFIVTGFKNEKIENFIKKEYPSIKVNFVNNNNYETTNNAYSLLLLDKMINDDFILVDSDIIFDYRILPLIINKEEKIKIALKKHKLSAEEIKVVIDNKFKIKKISKKISPQKAFGESIGIEFFPKKYIDHLFSTLRKRVIEENNMNEFYEATFEEMIKNGIDFYGVDINNLEAIEIDFIEDFKKAEELINDKKIS